MNEKSPCPFLCSSNSPIHVWVEITEKCNLNCPYCYMDAPQEGTELSLEVFSELINELNNMNISTISISGGEPLLNSNFKEILEKTLNYDFDVNLVTNGTLLNEEIMDIIEKGNITTQFSIDSVDREIYKKSRGKDKLEDVKKNLIKLSNRNIDLILAATLTVINQNNIFDLIDFCLENKISNLHIGELIPEGRSKNNNSIKNVNLSDLLEKLYEFQKENFERISIDIIEQFIYPIFYDEKIKYYCNALKGNTIEISSEGDVMICGGIRDKTELGNIHEKNIKEIYKESQLRKFNISVDDIEECKDCEYKYICGGGCRAIAYHNGGLNAKSPYCKDYKYIIQKIKNDYERGILDNYEEFLKLQSKDMPKKKIF